MRVLMFELYILSLLIFSKPNALGDSEANINGQKQTTEEGGGVGEKQQMTENQDDLSFKGKISPLERYKKLFTEHRAIQLNAVKSMQTFGSSEAQYKLVNIMLNQLFKNLNDANQNLTMWGFLPGDEFPTNETIRESVSKVLENTALFGDMLLRMPKTVHEFYDKNRDWHLLMAWAYTFSNESGVFDGPHEMLLHLMGQESGLIPKSPNYVNPFLAADDGTPKVPVSVVPTKKKEKKIKKIPRGPRLTRTEL